MAAALEVVEKERGTDEIASQKLEKALGEFNLPDDQNLLINWTQGHFEAGTKHFVLAGLGLIKLHMTAMQSYAVIIEENFPGLSERTAWNYMAVAKAALNHPAFQAFQRVRGGFSKILTVLSICSETQLDEADEIGRLCGYTVDQLAKMPSARTLEKALRGNREHERLAVRKATEKLSAENAGLRDQVRDLEVEVGQGETEADKAVALIKSATNKVMDGFRLLTKVDRPLMVSTQIVRDAMLACIDLGLRVLQNLETETCRTIAEAAAQAEQD